jgi:hypothetical protein
VGSLSPFTMRFIPVSQRWLPWFGVVGVGVAGWNTAFSCRGVLFGFGTLLGPEETPVGVFFGPLLSSGV